eukprot:CAMPEP_0194033402 /NCGR_PEP_ID=MMETSP0009_2-20130614/6118_1 /TAXON_ID=210454 /ORGANISM="Grammatophora oceanica, Strain CCMP 410" /LENGTH=175 /DNA_ID=CAMNT_0038674095 /DNA_START=123 /DNA_END=650 /DNA_ORIENTATION=-
MTRQLAALQLLLLSFLLSNSLMGGSAFVTTHINQRTFMRCLLTTERRSVASSASSSSISVKDSAGTEITVGSTVRVAVPDLVGYQVKSKYYGSFDESTKAFVPLEVDSKSAPRKERCLKIPVGIRGTVKKIYDAEKLSPNLPIQVKFTPGEATEEGYDPPTKFLMHFAANEIEVV